MAVVFPDKIIFLNRFYYPDHSATSQLLTDLVMDLVQRDETVHVITSRLCYDNVLVQLPTRESLNGVSIHRVWTSRFGRHFLPGRAIDYLTFHLSALFCLFMVAKKGDLVVVKTDPPMLSVTLLPVIWIRRAVLLTWNQDIFPDVAERLGVRGMGKRASNLLKKLRNISLRSAKNNVVVGESMIPILLEAGVSAKRIRVIHNWSDGQVVIPVAAEENSLRRAWGLMGRFVVGYSGNLGRAHEFNTLLDAAEQLKDREDIVFLFVGGGIGQEKMAAMAHARQLHNILLKPYQEREKLSLGLSVPDVHWISLLPKLEGLIVPSKFYGIIAAGRPVLYVGDTEGMIPKLLHEGLCGVTLPVGESHLLAQQIVQWADDQVTCLHMGMQSRALFDARFNRPLAMAAWQRVIRDTMA